MAISNLRQIAVFATIITCVFAFRATATTTWTGAAKPNSNWANDANWDNGAPGAGSDVSFLDGGNGNTNVILGGTRQVWVINFDTPNVGSYVLGASNSGDKFDFGEIGVIALGNSVVAPQTVNADMQTTDHLTLTLVNSAANLSIAGVISGTGALFTYNKGTVTLSAQSTFTGGTEIESALGLGTIRIAADTVGSAGSVTSGPFGTAQIRLFASSVFQPIGADRTIANSWNWFSGGMTFSNDTSIDSTPRSLLLAGPIQIESSKTLTNNLPAGATLTLGSAASPSTITRDKALTFQTDSAIAGSGGGLLVINDAISASASPLTFQSGIKATLNNTIAGNGNLIATAVGTVVHLNKSGLYSGTGSIQATSNATIHFDTAGAITGSGSLVAQTGGTIYLPFANLAFTGTTSIQGLSTDLLNGGGKLYVTNTAGSATGSGAVNVSTGTLGGNGIIGGTVNMLSSPNGAAHLAPGNDGPGKLAIGALSIAASPNCPACSLDIEIGGTVAGTDYDQLVVTGNAAIGGVASTSGTLKVSLINGFTRQALDTKFTILSAASRTGLGFTSLNFPGNDNAGWSVNYTSNSVEIVALGTGDFNHDAIVDAADFVTWRDDPIANGGALGYDRWRANFGKVIATSLPSQVPEPPATALFLTSIVVLISAKNRRS